MARRREHDRANLYHARSPAQCRCRLRRRGHGETESHRRQRRSLLKGAANFDTLKARQRYADVTARQYYVGNQEGVERQCSNQTTNGAIKGVNIAASIREAKAKLGTLKGEKTQAASQVEKTDFSELSASFNIKNGVAHNRDLSGKSPLLRLAGEGDIDIGNERLDYLLKATVVATAAGQGGKDLAALSGVTVPVKLSGTFTSPQYSIDFGGMAEGVAKAVVEKRRKKSRPKCRTKCRTGLKGYSGRQPVVFRDFA
jgi:AsmA protein